MADESLLQILIVEDTPAYAQLVARELETSGLVFTWTRVDSVPDLRDALQMRVADMVLCCLGLAGVDGLEALSVVRAHDPGLPFIMLGALSNETAVDCLKAGAWDYVLKEHRARLPFVVREVLAKRRTILDATAAHESLLESERRYRTLVNAGQALIWTCDSTGKNEYFNQPWLDYAGRTLDEELEDGFLARVHPDERHACLTVFDTAFGSRGPFTFVCRLRRRDGEYRTFKDEGTPRFDTHGHFLGYLGHCLDITDLLQAEAGRSRYQAAMAQAQKMESVGRLAGGVSHDFNNLLTGILGYCHLLLASMPPSSPYLADIMQIQVVAQRASTLTRQLLAFSRGQAMTPIALNLSTLISDLKKPLRTMLPASIELAWDLAPALEDVDGDPGQVEQAVYNLVTNAMDAMPEGGRLTLRTAPAVFDEPFVDAHLGAKPGRYVALSVTDTGRGIEESLLPLVFEPFVTTKGPGEGTGLGLAAVYGIVKQSDGYVAVESHLGQGAMFTMFFPVSSGAFSTPVPVTTLSAEDATGTETILFVEDDEALRVVLRRVFDGHGYRVLEARDGVDATARWLAEAGNIDLLLTDIVMPYRNGVEVARLFREMKPALPVLYMSGYTDPTVLKGVVLDDRTALIRKPYLPSVLVRQIREMLNRRSRTPRPSP